MKKTVIVLLTAALLFSALSLCGCGKKNPRSDAPSDTVPSDYDETTDAAAYQSVLDDMQGLNERYEKSFVRGVIAADALAGVLQRGEDSIVRLTTDETAEVKLPAGDCSDKELIFDAVNAALVSDASLGVLTVNGAGADGITLNGHVGKLAVYGENVNVTLSAGADTVYVQGKNCTLRLTGGEYGTILSVNQTVVIVNETALDVTVYMANGAPQTLKAGETLSFGEE